MPHEPHDSTFNVAPIAHGLQDSALMEFCS